jgi:hypothetical protein
VDHVEVKLFDGSPRYLVLHREMPRWSRDEYGQPDMLASRDGHYELHGTDAHPTLFKTLKMARKAVRDGVTWIKASEMKAKRRDGLILVFDANLLPVVEQEDAVFRYAGLADRLSESEFCERQIELWAARLAAARERESAPPTVEVRP